MSDLPEQQRKLLADRLFQAAVENVDKAHNPPTPSQEGEFAASAAANHARAARELTQAYIAVTKEGGR